MFVAASSRCFADLPFFEACGQIADLEFDKLELWMSSQGEHLRPESVVEDIERFHSQYRETTRLTPVGFGLANDVPPEVLQEISKLAKMMRVTQITVPASPLGTPFNMEIDRLRKFVEITARDGVRLSVKTETGHLSEDPQTAVELCGSVKGLGITLDPSYFICGPNRNRSFDQVFPHVYHVHLRDTSPDQLQVQIGLGDVDYSRLVTQLERENYRLALSVELIPEQLDTATRPLEMRKLRMLLETLL